MPRDYPLEIRNVGDDTYIVMSKGHHDPHEFMRAVSEHYDWPLGNPVHKWVKATPCPPACGSHTCHYAISDEAKPGWFPATYAWESYGDDAYKPPSTAGVKAAGGNTAPPPVADGGQG